MLESLSAFWAEYGDLLLEGTRDTPHYDRRVHRLCLPHRPAPGGAAEHQPAPRHLAPQVVQPYSGVDHQRGPPPALHHPDDRHHGLYQAHCGHQAGGPGANCALVVSAAPFIARMVETSLAEVDAGVVEAAQSMGGLPPADRVEGLPAGGGALPWILGASISIITLLGYTAIAGAVGAGGLGDLAIRYGYQRNVPP